MGVRARRTRSSAKTGHVSQGFDSVVLRPSDKAAHGVRGRGISDSWRSVSSRTLESISEDSECAIGLDGSISPPSDLEAPAKHNAAVAVRTLMMSVPTPSRRHVAASTAALARRPSSGESPRSETDVFAVPAATGSEANRGPEPWAMGSRSNSPVVGGDCVTTTGRPCAVSYREQLRARGTQALQRTLTQRRATMPQAPAPTTLPEMPLLSDAGYPDPAGSMPPSPLVYTGCSQPVSPQQGFWQQASTMIFGEGQDSLPDCWLQSLLVSDPGMQELMLSGCSSPGVTSSNLMAIAMPESYALSSEEIAEALRSAAPCAYED
eukprot:NODE_7502_length_1573_cov_6.605809.p1 GENE.NODE_7502_length_1573_cov_6.605809~~NODE_7502_length_1573_cov_6.605809.p1  ORF type:complete len:321 (-),score=65.91 NODE_7502_length_1573_cov_6.605809:524-1486(-)